MQSTTTARVQLLLSTLPLAGLLFATGVVGRGPSLDPSANPAGFAAAAVAANAAVAWFAILIGMIVEILGLCALYIVLADGRRERAAFWGLVLSVLGIALVLPLIGFLALAAPVAGRLYLAGQQEAIEVAVAMVSSGPALLLATVSGITYIAGSICFAVALRSILPRALVAGYALLRTLECSA